MRIRTQLDTCGNVVLFEIRKDNGDLVLRLELDLSDDPHMHMELGEDLKESEYWSNWSQADDS